MKCDELKEEYLWTNNVKTPSTIMVRAYNADKVDQAIAELKARIQLDDDEMAGFLDLEEECGGGDLRNYIAELKEEQRWRKFPEEKPSEEGYYIICGSSGFRNADKWTYCKDRQKMDFSFYSYGVAYWMPMPSAPKEDK